MLIRTAPDNLGTKGHFEVEADSIVLSVAERPEYCMKYTWRLLRKGWCSLPKMIHGAKHTAGARAAFDTTKAHTAWLEQTEGKVINYRLLRQDELRDIFAASLQKAPTKSKKAAPNVGLATVPHNKNFKGQFVECLACGKKLGLSNGQDATRTLAGHKPHCRPGSAQATPNTRTNTKVNVSLAGAKTSNALAADDILKLVSDKVQAATDTFNSQLVTLQSQLNAKESELQSLRMQLAAQATSPPALNPASDRGALASPSNVGVCCSCLHARHEHLRQVTTRFDHLLHYLHPLHQREI